MNPRKRRQSLDDSLAEEFVYGESSSEKDSAPKPDSESSLMDKLQATPKEATKRFTVDLPESMHRRLSILAAQTGRSKADIVRLLLQETLKDIPE